MKKSLDSAPITLGERLASGRGRNQSSTSGASLLGALLRALNAALFAGLSALSLWWYVGQSDKDIVPVLILLSALFVSWFFINRRFQGKSPHFLLVNDRQGFMQDLRLDEKTAIFDGSNIYHLGHDNKLDAQPIGEIADMLRAQGYRIVCFFDANIFHTLSDHGAFEKSTGHSRTLLEQIFGLKSEEIYVVPSGVQADKYILESLKYLPISFAVTNDRYRDYASQYPSVMKDNLWRKGVVISDGKVKLLHH